ncbi:NEDD4-binding protein 2-like 2 isoform X2 [Callithrix jacchus]|uniref:NEDD4 binding protein 2 like 2 n=1 Tax=Callithrix jacchus TaxID=9483 RepID=A0A8I3W906_CALJA|nr:NEDD4-binding protein 2-like 2 isoform X2 [Callithrix jacchus]XP_054112724.1 NEDD4-binding protein 2-like 2 isoform X2 [Callithrix jacchus]
MSCEIGGKFLGPSEEVTSEPRCKKLKSTAEACVFHNHNDADFHRIQEKTGNDWVPVTIIDVRGHSYLQEDKTKTTDLYRPLHDEMPGNRPDVIASIDSQVLQESRPPLVSTDDEIYSTSKAFIGPIYKPPEKKKRNERRNKADTLNGKNGRGGQTEKQKFNSGKSEIDNEFFQFYKEIEELEKEKSDFENSCKESEPSQEQFIPIYQGHNNGLLKPEEKKDFSNNALSSHCDYQQNLGNEPGKYPCYGQVIPTFCDTSFTFRPEWQSVHPFIVPHGPPLPSLNYHLNFQRFSAPPNPRSNIFQSQDDFQMQNGYYVNNCHVNWNCMTFDQNNEYTDCSENRSSVHPSGNGCSIQDEYVSNGFCEVRERCWKDPCMDKHNGTDRFVNQQFEEAKLNKLQKLLILLRGLPGSGKTTLSRRNKHGVSRKKIAQMLDRYEYQMSISIVMNSVEPSHKSPQRPPPPQGRQRERVLKKTGHRLSKTKQKRNRKRNKKQNSQSKIMEENSFEFSSDLTPGDQDPTQSEEEEIEKTRRESEYPFTGGLQNEVRDFVNGYKEKRWKNLDPKDSFQNVMSIVELDNTPKNSLSKEGDNLFLSLSWMPNESSVTCPIMTQNLSCVTTDDCSGMKVEKHIRNRHTIAWNTQDLPVETSCLFMKKREIDKNLPHQPILCPQHGTRMSDKVLREEQLYATKINYWAFLTTNLSDEGLQLGSDRQPYFGSWPAVLLKFVCEQRPKKDRAHKLTGPDSRGQWIQLIFTSMGASEPGSSPEILIVKLLIGNEDFSPPPETIDSFIETNLFRSCLPQLDIPKNALESTQNKKRRQKRIFNLVPNFNLLGPNHMNVKEREKCDLLTKAQGVKIISGEEKDRISERNGEEENKQKRMTFDHHPLWFYLDIIKAPPLNIGGQYYSHCPLFNRLRCSTFLYENYIPSLVLHYISSVWKASFTNKLFCTFESQTREGNKINDAGFISPEILHSQPDTSCSLGVTSDFHFLNERFDGKLKRWEEPKQLPAEDSQGLTRTEYSSLGLPLTQGFAFQLVKLFGSPGVPMESLLPNDYVVPLDWKTLKMIYLQWKMSVEKRQKKIG